MSSKKSEKNKSKEYYVNPDEMWGEFDSFYKKLDSAEDPSTVEMSPILGKMLDDIATKLGYMGRFINYSYKDEMIGDARIKMVKAVYDRNFTLWGTSYCTRPFNETDRSYVYVFSWSKEKEEWVNKKVYLKEWDTVRKLDTPLVHDDEVIYMELEDGTEVEVDHDIVMKNNPFSYFTKVAYHAFVNRIKKEQKVAEVLALYQEKVYEEIYSSGNGWENVKRAPLEDENEYYYEHSLDEMFDEDHDADDADDDSYNYDFEEGS